MNLTLELLALAAIGLSLATVYVYESYIGRLRAELAEAHAATERAVLFAEDSQVLAEAAFAEADARRRHPSYRGLRVVEGVR
jgi:hypothetical protein